MQLPGEESWLRDGADQQILHATHSRPADMGKGSPLHCRWQRTAPSAWLCNKGRSRLQAADLKRAGTHCRGNSA